MTEPDVSDGDASLASENWSHVRALVEETLTLPGEARPAFLKASCGDDDALRRRVERLAAACERADESWGFLAHPAGELAAPLLAAGADPLAERRLAGMVEGFARLTAALADRYRIERELGAGGMATVYLAHDIRHGRQVAIKVLRPELSAVLGAQRFLSEIKTTAALQHPHILPLFDSGTADGLLFYVMPLVEGETLRARLTREKQLPVADAVSIASEVAGALDYAHRRGVIHRDIKPENILLHEGRPIVADFGIALAVESARAERMTQPGLPLGTPQYMSPEQVTGEQEITARSDIYALGVVTYEMLIGETPFTGVTVQQILARVRTEEPRAITAQRKHVAPHVEAAVLTALEKLPADRFESAGEFARALSNPGFRGTAQLDRLQPQRSPRRRSAPYVVGGLVIAVAIAAAVWLRATLVDSTRPAAVERSIAVLPFANVSGDQQDAAFVDGLSEELIAVLAKIGNLRVIARTSAFAFRNSNLGVRRIADSLGVSNLLEGGVQKVGSQLRVQVRLVDARDGSTRWSETYDRQLKDIFSVQSDIADAVAHELDLRLGESTLGRIKRGSTHNIAAYELYLRGNDPALTRSDSGARAGVDYFSQAIALDPSYAAAYAGLARMRIRSPFVGDRELPVRDRLALAEQAALKAVALDDSLGEAHATLSFVRGGNYDLASAESELMRAVELEPTNARFHESLVRLYASEERPAEALVEARRALELDPLSPTANAELAHALLANDRCDEALRELEKLRSLRPPLLRASSIAAQCYARKRMWPEAIAEMQRISVNGGRRSQALLAYMLARAGRTDQARQILAGLLDRSRRIKGGAFEVAIVYAGLGENDQAFAWLDKAVDDRSLAFEFLPTVWDGLRSDPRFDHLRSRIGLQKR
jgi:serine/threonine protein kinase/tetratricopeptide (TPR) repeat protein